jgi:hypothetical protein
MDNKAAGHGTSRSGTASNSPTMPPRGPYAVRAGLPVGGTLSRRPPGLY